MANLKKLLMVSAVIASPVHAQNVAGPDQIADRIDSRSDIGDADESEAFFLEGGAPPKLNWELAVGIPFTFNSNVTNAATGRLSAFHATPSVSLKRTWDLGSSAKLIVSAGADADVYTEYGTNDFSTLNGSAELNTGDPTAALAPYARYTAVAAYGGQFESHKFTHHTFGAGVRRKFVLASGNELGIDANIMRREADLPGLEQFRYSGSANLKSPIDPRTAWSLQLRLQRYDYTGGANAARADTNLKAALGLTRKLADAMSINFDMSLVRNWSNTALKSYSTFDVGPTLKFLTKF